jgi:hypothetical protein
MKRLNIYKAGIILTGFFLAFSSLYAQTDNTGIGTRAPGSTLTVNGSLAATYKNITAATYTLQASDYYLAWNGSSAGTVTLSAAVSGSGNFSGRVYHIKNTSASSSLTIAANGSELMDDQSGPGVASITLPAGYYGMFISKGTASGVTWEVAIVGSSVTAFANNWTPYTGTLVNPFTGSTGGGGLATGVSVTIPAKGWYFFRCGITIQSDCNDYAFYINGIGDVWRSYCGSATTVIFIPRDQNRVLYFATPGTYTVLAGKTNGVVPAGFNIGNPGFYLDFVKFQN